MRAINEDKAKKNKTAMSKNAYDKFCKMKCSNSGSIFDNITYFNKCDFTSTINNVTVGNSHTHEDPKTNFGQTNYISTSTLNVLTWNLESFENKKSAVKSLIHLTSPDVLCFQETYLNESKAKELKHDIKDFTMTSQSKDKYMTCKDEKASFRNKHGVATLLSDDLSRRSKFIESNSDRILCQRIQFGGRSLLIINMYQFTTGNSPQAI